MAALAVFRSKTSYVIRPRHVARHEVSSAFFVAGRILAQVTCVVCSKTHGSNDMHLSAINILAVLTQLPAMSLQPKQRPAAERHLGHTCTHTASSHSNCASSASSSYSDRSMRVAEGMARG